MATTVTEYTNPWTGEEITEQELQTFCKSNDIVLKTAELYQIYQESVSEDKKFLHQIVDQDFDIDSERLAAIEELYSDNFNKEQYLEKRQTLVVKNLQRVSRRSQYSDHWKCSDCRVTGDIHFMYQHECSESRVKKKKERKQRQKQQKWAGEIRTCRNSNQWHQIKDTPPSSKYLGPAWLTPTCHSDSKQIANCCRSVI
jgi:hypothetical protein